MSTAIKTPAVLADKNGSRTRIVSRIPAPPCPALRAAKRVAIHPHHQGTLPPHNGRVRPDRRRRTGRPLRRAPIGLRHLRQRIVPQLRRAQTARPRRRVQTARLRRPARIVLRPARSAAAAVRKPVKPARAALPVAAAVVVVVVVVEVVVAAAVVVKKPAMEN